MNGNMCVIEDDGSGCVGQAYEGESIPLDIYIMFDQSGSMLNDVGGLTRLEAVQQATRDFLRDPASAGIGVGIGYFGYQPIGETRCDEALYASPDVPVSVDHEPVIRSLDGREPTGETPTASALRGSCTYASGWKRMHPGRGVVILLVTDGKPERD
jgi:Mg-chelatase subunit ChlD